MTRRNKDVGDWGEQQACIFLQRHGFRIVERNYYTTMGEIDVIAVKGNDFY
jgi:putative endonuclease